MTEYGITGIQINKINYIPDYKENTCDKCDIFTFCHKLELKNAEPCTLFNKICALRKEVII